MHLPTLTPRALYATLMAALLLHGCASSRAEKTEQVSTPEGALAGMIGRQVAVLPAQLIAVAGPGGEWDVQPGHAPLLRTLDAEIADALRKRGVRSNWTFADQIIASAARNAGLAGNPLGLSVAGIRRWKAGDTPLPEPLASEIRTLVSLTSARYVVLPLETRIDARQAQPRVMLRVLLIDARTARVLWAGDIEGKPAATPAAAAEMLSPQGFLVLAQNLAGLFADMVVAQ